MMMSGAFSGLTVFRSSRIFPKSCRRTFIVTPFPALQAVALLSIDGFCTLSTQTVIVVAVVAWRPLGADEADAATNSATVSMATSAEMTREMRLLSMCVLPFVETALVRALPPKPADRQSSPETGKTQRHLP